MTELNVVEHISKAPQFIMGMVRCFDHDMMRVCWPIVQPGLDELAQMSEGEWNSYGVRLQVFGGSMHLYMCYVDQSGESVDPARFQMIFVDKLRNPEKDFAGFAVIQPLQTAVHIFAVYIMPEFRGSNLYMLGMRFLEGEIKKMGAPYISLSAMTDVYQEQKDILKRFRYKEMYTTYRKKI